MATLGQRLRAAREAKGLSLREVAKQADISPTALSFLETDQADSKRRGVTVKEETLVALAGVLGEKPITLMALAGKMPRELQDIVLSHPEEFELLIRRLKGVSRNGVVKVAEVARKVRDGKW